jgi:hypothetical protein
MTTKGKGEKAGETAPLRAAGGSETRPYRRRLSNARLRAKDQT